MKNSHSSHEQEPELHFEQVPQLYRLTSLRFIAAAAVFLYHVAKDTNWLPHEWLFRYGFSGVGFFFILSGFVLTWAYRRPVRPGEFYVRRIARVYPSHLIMALVAVFLPVLASPVTFLGIFANLSLTQAWFVDWSIVFSLNAVSWSLSCEAFFYLLSPWVIRWLRRTSSANVVLISGSWFAICSLASIGFGISGNMLDVWAYTNPLFRSGEFIAGVALAILVQRGWTPRIPFTVAITLMLGAGVIVSLWRGNLPQTVVDVILAPVFATVILAGAIADIRQKKGLMCLRWLVYAGQVSFAFYLVHELVIMNLAAAFASSQTISSVLQVFITLALSVLLAVLLHHTVERPGQKMLISLWKKRRLQLSGTLFASRMEKADESH